MGVAPVGIQRPQRWDRPFDPATSESDVARVLAVEPFRRIDASRFPQSLPLDGILRNDARLVRHRPGDIVVRRGDYGSSAFFVLEGELRVELDPGDIPDELLGRSEPTRTGWRRALAQLWSNSPWPEQRRVSPDGGAGLAARRDERDELRIFLQDLPTVLAGCETAALGSGAWFGELAALGRTPRTATVFAAAPSELLEIRWQGLRDIRSRAPEIKEHIDSLYRERALSTHLHETPLFAHLDDDKLGEVSAEVEFETYGNFDWYGSYRSLVERSAAERLQAEPIIAEEGHYPNGVILIRSGFARVSRRHGHGEQTVSYLGAGQAYGIETIATSWRTGMPGPLPTTLRAVGYVDVLRVPSAVMERDVLPTLPRDMLAALEATPDGQDSVDVEMLEFLVEERFINGRAAMVIDLDRCTRCDDCVRACEATHDGNPRFVRNGPTLGSVQIAHACMHCADPVCMIGCPTGAIHRDSIGGQVAINDVTCVGCGTCAQSCPYENIQMVRIRNQQGHVALDRDTRAPILKAAKCDLCRDQLGGPACARACPHDALARLDLTRLDALSEWLRR